jgi:hypothetical protein
MIEARQLLPRGCCDVIGQSRLSRVLEADTRYVQQGAAILPMKQDNNLIITVCDSTDLSEATSTPLPA